MTPRKSSPKDQADSLSNEESFRLLFDNHPVPMWIYDLESLAFLEVNEAAVEKYGYSRDEFLALTLKDIHLTEDVPRLLEDVKQKRPALQHSGEWRHRLKDGRVIDVEITSRTIEFNGREAALVMAQDVTERVRAHDALQTREAELRATLYSIGDAVISTDGEGRVARMNPVAETLTGWSEAEARGQPLEEVFRIVNEESRAVVENPVARVLREGVVIGLANHSLLIARDGREFPIADAGAPIRDAQGAIAGVVLVFRDQTQEREAQRTRALLARVVEGSDDAIISKTLDGIILSWNAGAERIYGYTADEIIGHPISILTPSGKMDETMPVLERIQRGERIKHFETERIRKDGKKIQVSLAISPIQNVDGRIVGASTIARDITERKQTEEEIKSLAKFPSENPNPVLRIDQEGILLYANQATFLLLADWNLQIGQAVPEVLRELMRETFVDQHVQTADIPCGERVFLVAAAPITETGYSNLYIQDVTERKRAEEALREAEAWFRTTLYSIGDAVITTDAKSRVQQMNPVAEALTGWREAEARGKPLAEVFYIVNEETRRAVENPVTRVLREGVVIGLGNHTLLIARDGTERPIADAGAPIRNDRGEAVGVVLVFRDQTAERAAQKALRESEERFSTVFRSSPIGISITRLADGKVSDANPTFLRMFGYTHEEVIGRTTLELNVWAHPEDRDRMFKLLREQGGVKDFETQFRKKSGEIGDLLVSAEVIDLAGEQFLLSLMQNITERKRAETELYIALEKYRVLFESFPLGISVTDAAGNLIEVNRESERLLGIPRDEHTRRMYDGPEWRIVRPDGLPMPPDEYASVRALREKRLVENVEMGIVKGGGEITWISVTAAPIPLEGYGVAIAYGDITERKRAEEAVQVRSQIIDAAIDSVFIHDLDGNILYVNESAAKTRGYTRDEMIGMNLSQLDTPEFAPLSQPRIKDLLKTGQARFDSVHRCKDGSLMLIDIRVQLIEYYGNTAVLGIVRDITERKQAEEALRESEEKYRNVVERANDGITIIQDTIVKYLNPSLAELWGGTVEEVIGTPFANYIHPDELPVVLDRYQRRMAGEDVIPTYETVLKRKDGSKAYVELNAGTIMFQREPADLAIVRDITERKRAEAALRESRARQARAALAQPGGGPGRRAPPYCT